MSNRLATVVSVTRWLPPPFIFFLINISLDDGVYSYVLPKLSTLCSSRASSRVAIVMCRVRTVDWQYNGRWFSAKKACIGNISFHHSLTYLKIICCQKWKLPMFYSVDAILMNNSSTKLTEDTAFHLTSLLQN